MSFFFFFVELFLESESDLSFVDSFWTHEFSYIGEFDIFISLSSSKFSKETYLAISMPYHPIEALISLYKVDTCRVYRSFSALLCWSIDSLKVWSSKKLEKAHVQPSFWNLKHTFSQGRQLPHRTIVLENGQFEAQSTANPAPFSPR